MTRIAPMAYAVARIVVGLLFAAHGAQKLFGLFGSPPMTGNAMMLVAGIIELACGLLVMVGLFARIAAFVAAGEMAVAYFMVHQPQAFWPIENKGEAAVLYCFYFLVVATSGAGIASLDALRGRPVVVARERPAV